jgi:hypothetical protein
VPTDGPTPNTATPPAPRSEDPIAYQTLRDATLVVWLAVAAHRVAKPRRLPSTRRALTAWELEQINATARSCGDDVILDALLLRLHTETACRRGGALAIRVEDLDPDCCLVCFHEKGDTVRWQPITPALATCLVDHAAARGASLPTDQLLRYRNGRPLTRRRYENLWERLGDRLPWVAAQGISTHWLRHTTLTWVERHFHYGVARAYAGHTDSTGPATTTYIRASLQEVATALAAMTGQPHPLALPPWTSTTRLTGESPARAMPLRPSGVAHLTQQNRRLLPSEPWKSPENPVISEE